jgi:hypothetical protein
MNKFGKYDRSGLINKLSQLLSKNLEYWYDGYEPTLEFFSWKVAIPF